MKKEIRNLNVFEKMQYILDLAKKRGIETDLQTLRKWMCHISHYHGDRDYRKELTEEEAIFYDFLLKEDFSPATIYKWVLLSSSPSDIKMKLREGLISQKKALNLRARKQIWREVQLGSEILKEARAVVRGL